MLDYKKILGEIIDINDIREKSKSKLYQDLKAKFICDFTYLKYEFEIFIPQYFPLVLPKITILSKLIHSHINDEGVVCLPRKEDIDYDITDEETVLKKTINSLKNLFNNSAEKEEIEINYEYNDYLPFFSNYNDKKCLLCSFNNKGQLVIENDRILIGIDNDLFKKYEKRQKKKYTHWNYKYLELKMLPTITNELTANEIYSCLTDSSKKVMEQTTNKSFNQYYLLGYNLNNGITNYIFIHLTMKKITKNTNPFLSENSKIVVHSVRDITLDFLRTRGGSSHIYDKVLVIGCGSIGSEVVEMLASSGFLNIAIVDNDVLKYENTFRYTTGFYYFHNYEEYLKVDVLKDFIEHKYPDVHINKYNNDIIELLVEGNLSLEEYKYIIVSVGNNVIHKFINNYIYEKKLTTNLIYCWLEPFGIGEHILTVNTSKCGCYNCLCKSQHNVHFSMEDEDYKIRNNVCSGSYTPYGRISTINIATRISKILLDDYYEVKKINNAHYVTKGNFNKYLNEKLKLTKYANMSQTEIDDISRDFIFEGCEICGKLSD